MTDTAIPGTSQTAPRADAASKYYLFGPVLDFLCLGGGSLFIIFPIFLWASDELRPSLVLATFFMMFLINQPHFAHSYQIFYTDFRQKLLGGAYPPHLRFRYALSGIVVPITMILFFAACYITQNAKLAGLAVNVLALTVGWHYVKQGYGMLMVECVLKRCFFNDREKARLKLNAYVIWVFSWVFANHVVEVNQYQGLTAFAIDLPDWVLALTALCALASTLLAVATVAAKGAVNGGRLPYNGIVAYVASVYIWIYAIYTDPLLLLVVPAFHSIQYLTVVWRYQLNKARAEVGNDKVAIPLPGGSFQVERYVLRLARFVVGGTLLGLIGFQAAPYLMKAGNPDGLVFGPFTFIAMFWIFFNVHHFFLDNVMWRKENPDIKRHLFTPG